MSRRRRLDEELVRRALVDSRAQAQHSIAAGRVIVGGAPANKAARLVDPGDAIEVLGERPQYVSRGGQKLAAALARFDVGVRGARVMDAGASTGGFTDCALQHGASEVVAVDVGRNQLHERLRHDPRVRVFEKTNVRVLTPEAVGGEADLVVCDLSFISVRVVADPLVSSCRDGGDLVVLVKPQFEARKAEADRGRGVIRDPEVWHKAIESACSALEAAGAAIMDAMVSPITGAEGNVEFLVHARRGASPVVLLDSLVDQLVAEAAAR